MYTHRQVRQVRQVRATLDFETFMFQFSLLAETLAQERQEIQVRKKAQEKVNIPEDDHQLDSLPGLSLEKQTAPIQ